MNLLFLSAPSDYDTLAEAKTWALLSIIDAIQRNTVSNKDAVLRASKRVGGIYPVWAISHRHTQTLEGDA